MEIQPIILAGGNGTRLWPLSRTSHPKQFLPFVEDLSLFDLTLKRLEGIADKKTLKSPLVVCNKENRFFVAEHFRKSEIENGQILLEPCGRNTAPALTLAALHTLSHSADAVMFVLPSDHLVADTEAFSLAAAKAVALAAEGRIVTMGIVPSAPETGFGYIEFGEPVSSAADELAHDLKAFVEKPDAATAQQYLDSGGYLWNSGMFVLTASTWLNSIEKFQPDIYKQCQAAYQQSKQDVDFYWINEKAFALCPDDSIDYAVMEKQSRLDAEASPIVVKLDAGWSDVGSWSSYWETHDKNESGNVLVGDSLAFDSTDSLLLASSRLVTAVGVDNLVVVETKDAVLIVDKNKTQDVRKVIDYLKTHQREEMNYHREVHRPWGTYDTVDAGDRFIVKRIVVKPGAALSLQLHHHRAEHWIVVKGTAKVTRGEETFLMSENQSTYISIGQKHRLENPGNISLEMIEVQSGGYLQEDDIVRFEDVYNRASDQ